MAETAEFFEDFQQSLPPYTYVPGVTPHPISDPAGHLFEVAVPSLSLQQTLRRGCQLFNHGYYWEAHEVWEAGWNILGAQGPDADFIKALIKLAACGVKCLQQNAAGASKHAVRARELFQNCGALFESEQRSREVIQAVNALQQLASGIAGRLPLAPDSQQATAKRGGVTILPSIEEKYVLSAMEV